MFLYVLYGKLLHPEASGVVLKLAVPKGINFKNTVLYKTKQTDYNKRLE
jgi:hypothetical protein